jgi:hypothetical protein
VPNHERRNKSSRRGIAFVSAPTIDESFPHHWQAEVLPARPAILPARHYVYPRQAEEVERGALEVLIRPAVYQGMISDARETLPEGSVSYQGMTSVVPQNAEVKDGALAPEWNVGAPGLDSETWEIDDPNPPTPGAPSPLVRRGGGTGEGTSHNPRTQAIQPFLATCALGFRAPSVPTGIWSSPNPDEVCLVAGGYAYIIDTTTPERFTMIPFRPVLQVSPALEAGLLLFVGHHSILAWGREGQAWESEKLSDEGVTITSIENGILRGKGWHILTDKETPFALDLRNGVRQT